MDAEESDCGKGRGEIGGGLDGDMDELVSEVGGEPGLPVALEPDDGIGLIDQGLALGVGDARDSVVDGLTCAVPLFDPPPD